MPEARFRRRLRPDGRARRGNEQGEGKRRRRRLRQGGQGERSTAPTVATTADWPRARRSASLLQQGKRHPPRLRLLRRSEDAHLRGPGAHVHQGSGWQQKIIQ